MKCISVTMFILQTAFRETEGWIGAGSSIAFGVKVAGFWVSKFCSMGVGYVDDDRLISFDRSK